jgi:hypothetical protein
MFILTRVNPVYINISTDKTFSNGLKSIKTTKFGRIITCKKSPAQSVTKIFPQNKIKIKIPTHGLPTLFMLLLETRRSQHTNKFLKIHLFSNLSIAIAYTQDPMHGSV